jgi:CRP/FNR family transcriptional regulator, cyclic AMP receptor protein
MSELIELNFTVPPPKPNYDVKGALKFIEAAGTLMNIAAGQTLFVENENSNPLLLQTDKMYFLVEGEIDLTVKSKLVGVVRKGELFGEMALITKMPRSATATATTACRLYSLDKDQLLDALQAAPEFGLLLMSMMITRLRNTITLLSARGALSRVAEDKDSAVFDKKVLEKLMHELDDSTRMRYARDKVIVQEGQAGVLMYVVLEGTVAISIKNNVVAEIGPGGMFGEMALITHEERLASAIAKTDCMLLAINRNIFLDLVRTNPKFAISLLGAVGNRARFMASQLA